MCVDFEQAVAVAVAPASSSQVMRSTSLAQKMPSSSSSSSSSPPSSSSSPSVQDALAVLPTRVQELAREMKAGFTDLRDAIHDTAYFHQKRFKSFLNFKMLRPYVCKIACNGAAGHGFAVTLPGSTGAGRHCIFFCAHEIEWRECRCEDHESRTSEPFATDTEKSTDGVWCEGCSKQVFPHTITMSHTMPGAEYSHTCRGQLCVDSGQDMAVLKRVEPPEQQQWYDMSTSIGQTRT
eukprot:3283077-Amphidinium_carterae.3